jgi:uncharacterized protein (TIGR02246 family)
MEGNTNRTLLGLTLPVLLTILAACAVREPMPMTTAAAPLDNAAIEASLDSVRVALEQAFAARDVNAMAALYAPDAIFSPQDGPPVQGRDSIRALFERKVPHGATANLSVTDLRVLTGEWAYAYGTIRVGFTPHGAAAPVQVPSTFLVMLRNTPEGWKIFRESLSADAPHCPVDAR